jgi:hypothetical protein
LAVASLSTNLTGATNNDLDFTAKWDGASGNSISVQYVDPGAASQSLSVSVTGYAIQVSLATNGSSTITSTAALVEAAVEAHATAAELVSVANKAANDGTGVVAAMAKTNLSSGSGEDAYANKAAAVADGWVAIIEDSNTPRYVYERKIDGRVYQQAVGAAESVLLQALKNVDLHQHSHGQVL